MTRGKRALEALDDDIRDFDISQDGSQVVLERVQERSDVVLLDPLPPILKKSLKGKGRPGMGCDGGDIEPQPLGLLWKLRAAAAIRSAPDPACGESDAGTWPQPSHTPLQIVGGLPANRKLTEPE
jgi:hypothetical protein